MVCEPIMALLMTAPGSLIHRKILAGISLKLRASQALLSTFKICYKICFIENSTFKDLSYSLLALLKNSFI